MGLNAKEAKGGGGKSYPAVEAGSYPARTVLIVDLGVQEQRPFKGETKPPVQELQIVYELLDEFLPDEDGNPDETKPRWMWERFPLFSLNADRAKSTKRYTALDQDLKYDGDWSKLIDVPCVVTISKDVDSKDKTKTYNNVENVSAMRSKDALKAPDLVNEALVLSLDEADLETWEKLPDGIKKRVQAGLEWEGTALGKALATGRTGDPRCMARASKPVVSPEVDDDIPFDDDALNDNEDVPAPVDQPSSCLVDRRHTCPHPP